MHISRRGAGVVVRSRIIAAAASASLSSAVPARTVLPVPLVLHTPRICPARGHLALLVSTKATIDSMSVVRTPHGRWTSAMLGDVGITFPSSGLAAFTGGNFGIAADEGVSGAH
jgi:hypothetical protein